VSFGIEQTTGIRMPILGPTEYLSLSSGAHTPEETGGPSKKVRLLIKEHNGEDVKKETGSFESPRMKNVVKM